MKKLLISALTAACVAPTWAAPRVVVVELFSGIP
jgi:hypothetical protein